MDGQLPLSLTSREEREEGLEAYVEPLKLERREVLVLRLLAGRGERTEINGQTASRLSISKATAAAACGCAPGTFTEGVRDLQRRGVLDVLRSARPWTYLVNWSRVDKIKPPPAEDPAAGLPLFSDDWAPERVGTISDDQRRSATISDDQRAHTKNKKLQETHNQTKPNHGRADRTDSPAGPLRLAIDNAELAAALRGGPTEPLAKLFRSAVAQEYLDDTAEDKTKFLALVHHSVTAPGIHNPAGVIYRAIDAYNFSRVRGASWDYAAEFLRGRHADRARRTQEPVRHLVE